MAELEEAGYIQQPHTSGGRVPTDLGYRYYVRFLMGDVELPSVEQIMIRHQFRQVELQLEQWITLAATVLAETAGTVSVVTAPRTAVPRLRHFELVAIQPRMALLILVTYESLVRQMMVHWPEDVDQAQLRRLTDSLVGAVQGQSAAELLARANGAEPLARLVLEHLGSALRSMDAAEQVEIHHSGFEHMLGQPDFAETDLHGLLDLLRGGAFISAVLPQLRSDREIEVFIGDENPANELRRFGLVVGTYGVAGSVTGLLGVVGPTRMSYSRSISSVRYIAALMSDFMAELYAVGPGAERRPHLDD